MSPLRFTAKTLLAALSLAGSLACAPRTSLEPLAPGSSPVFASMVRGGRGGPNYSLRVHDDWTVDFQGHRHPEQPVLYAKWKLTEVQMFELRKLLGKFGERAGVAGLDCAAAPDAATTTISYELGETKWTLAHNLSCMTPQARELVPLEFRFDKVVESERVIGSLAPFRNLILERMEQAQAREQRAAE